jgi:hypothetical protein
MVLPLKELTKEEFAAGLPAFKFLFLFYQLIIIVIIQIRLPGERLVPAEGGLFRFKFPARKKDRMTKMNKYRQIV